MSTRSRSSATKAEGLTFLFTAEETAAVMASSRSVHL